MWWNFLNSRNSQSEVFLWKSVLKIRSKFTGENPCRSAISMKLLYNFIVITLRHGCSPVNLPHVFRTPFLKRTFGWLLLKLWIVLLQALKKKSSDWGKRIDWFEKFIKKSVLRNFAEFTGKHLCQNLFFNKVAVHRSPKTCTWLHEQFRTFHPSLHESVTIFLLTIN